MANEKIWRPASTLDEDGSLTPRRAAVVCSVRTRASPCLEVRARCHQHKFLTVITLRVLTAGSAARSPASGSPRKQPGPSLTRVRTG